MENKQIQQQVEAAMHSLDQMQSASPKPFLLTRIRARIANAEPYNFWSEATRFLCRPVVLSACLLIFIVSNFIALSLPQTTAKPATNAAVSFNTQNSDISVTIAGIYDFENSEP